MRSLVLGLEDDTNLNIFINEMDEISTTKDGVKIEFSCFKA